MEEGGKNKSSITSAITTLLWVFAAALDLIKLVARPLKLVAKLVKFPVEGTSRLRVPGRNSE